MNSEEECIERRAGEMKNDGDKVDNFDLSATTNPSVWANEFNKCLVQMGRTPLDPGFLATWFHNAMAAMELRVCAYYESPLRNPATHKDYMPYKISDLKDATWITKAQWGPPKWTTFSVPTVPGYWYNSHNHTISISTLGIDSGHRGFETN